MKRNQLLRDMAPCSLLCYTCGGYKYGIMSQLSKDLLNYTDGVYEFFKKHVSFDNRAHVEQFAVFRKVLQERSDVQCEGCRESEHHGCSIKGCFINECAIEHGVDFCGECADFPCDKVISIFETEAYQQWLDGNTQIQKIGAQRFYESKKQQSHYAAYLDD